MKLFEPFVLTTPRFVIRPLRDDDMQALFAIWSDTEAMRYFPFPAVTRLDQAKDRVTRKLMTSSSGQELNPTPLMSPRIESAPAGPATRQSGNTQVPAIVPAHTALVVMHYQTDIIALFPAVAPTLLANTRKLCDAARNKGVSVYFAKIQFSPGYPEVSPLNRNGQGIKQLGLFVDDAISPELGKQADEPLIIAHRASVFFGTDLKARLRAQGIDTLIMVGIASTGVVLSSVAYASDADFRLLTVKDCCYDPDQIVHDHLFSTAFDSRTMVLSLAEALALLA